MCRLGANFRGADGMFVPWKGDRGPSSLGKPTSLGGPTSRGRTQTDGLRGQRAVWSESHSMPVMLVRMNPASSLTADVLKYLSDPCHGEETESKHGRVWKLRNRGSRTGISDSTPAKIDQSRRTNDTGTGGRIIKLKKRIGCLLLFICPNFYITVIRSFRFYPRFAAMYLHFFRHNTKKTHCPKFDTNIWKQCGKKRHVRSNYTQQLNHWGPIVTQQAPYIQSGEAKMYHGLLDDCGG